ncbi:aromatic acid exporter family protein [Streptomyces sp. NPDC006971]|uniref:aromatic acid exporter family protein n=1 Tax=Streptomyces sp. NPDC006971 TaxID=3154784 RepID=UPI0033D75ACF
MTAHVLARGQAVAVRWRNAGRAWWSPRAFRSVRPAAVRTVKVLIAALLAWQAASWWLPGEQRYLAVATALAMVSAPTVYRSVTQALRSVAARAAGLAVAVAVVWLLGPAAGSAAAIPAIALVVAGRRGSDSRLQVASTAVLALAAATAVPVDHVVALTLATLTGAVAGIAVNALILPPVHLSASDSAVRGLAVAMGELLVDMGRGLRERRHADRAHAWLEQGRRLEDLAVRAHEDVRESQESLRWNTRCVVVRGRREPSGHGEALRALHRITFQVRGIARTLADTVDDRHTGHRLGQMFLDRYAATLEAAGGALKCFATPGAADGSAEDDARDRLRRAIDDAAAWHTMMTGEIKQGALTEPGAWHVYGSLMTDAERLLADLDRAARSAATSQISHP